MTSKEAKPKKKAAAKKKAVKKVVAKKPAAKKAAPKKSVKKAAAKPKTAAAKKPPVKKASAKKPAVKKALAKKPAPPKKKPAAKKALAKAVGAGGVKALAADAVDLANVVPPSIRFLQVPDGSELRVVITEPSPRVQNPAAEAINGNPARTWTSTEVNDGKVVVDIQAPNRYQVVVDFLFLGAATVKGEAKLKEPTGSRPPKPFVVTGSAGDHAQLSISAISLT